MYETFLIQAPSPQVQVTSNPQPQVSVEVNPKQTDLTTVFVTALEKGSFPLALIFCYLVWKYGGKVMDSVLETLKVIRDDSQVNRGAVLHMGENIDQAIEKRDTQHETVKESLDRLEDASQTIIAEVRELKDASNKPKGWFK